MPASYPDVDAAVENALVSQKDQIFRLILTGSYTQAIMLLRFSRDLWKAHAYDYKTRELLDRIRTIIRHNLMHCHPNSARVWNRLAEQVGSFDQVEA